MLFRDKYDKMWLSEQLDMMPIETIEALELHMVAESDIPAQMNE